MYAAERNVSIGVLSVYDAYETRDDETRAVVFRRRDILRDRVFPEPVVAVCESDVAACCLLDAFVACGSRSRVFLADENKAAVFRCLCSADFCGPIGAAVVDHD